MPKQRKWMRWLSLSLAIVTLFASCGEDNSAGDTSSGTSTALPAGERPTTLSLYLPQPGTEAVFANDLATIDATNASQGYVMVKYTGQNAKVKLQISKSGETPYTYDLTSTDFEAFNFNQGDGSYLINVFENISGSEYALAFGTTVEVALADELLPFLYANQYVRFTAESMAVKKGEELASTAKDELEVVANIYHYVTESITYDTAKAELAAAGQISGYLPDLDEIMTSGTGICFDYAALMTAMLRTQGIPTKLVIGYAGEVYHAWISTYVTDVGWIDKVIEFDGTSWKLMDPTFASGSQSSQSLAQYIGDGSSYNPLYYY